MKLKFLIVFGFAVTLFAACGGEDCSSPDITYTEGASAIINTSCAATPACHGNGTTATFPMSNYDQALAATSFGRIIGSINHQEGFRPMPFPEGSLMLEECEIDKLTAWINAGAPE